MKEKIKKENFAKLEGKQIEVAEEIRNRLYNEVDAFIAEELKAFNEEQAQSDLEKINWYFANANETIWWRNKKNSSVMSILESVSDMKNS